jgi:beta-lactamase regulating signal transducer with metallopeptidase domain/biopolymer transport protein ExbD
MIEAANEYGRQWAGFFGLAVLQNTVFLGLVFLALYVFRRAPARIKYIIGAVGTLKLLVPPFLPLSFVGSSSTVLSTVPYLASNIVFTSSPAGPTPGSVPAPALDVLGLMFIVWAGAAALYLFYALVTTCRLAARLRAATEIPVDPAFDDLDVQGVKILRSDRISLPLTVGVFPRRIYVPDTWEQWSEGCRKMAVRHELAHIKRHDGLFLVMEILARALYFFHPLVWLLSRRLEGYREMACDDASTGVEQDSRLRYSRNLVEIAETVARDTLTCQSASALLRRKNALLKRVSYQMKEELMRSVSKKTMAMLLASLTLLILPLSWYQTGAAPEPPAPDKNTTASASGAKSSSGMQTIDVSIKSADKIDVSGSAVTLESFGETLDEVAKGDPGTYVINLICANDVPMWVVFDVQRNLQKRDLVKVSYNSDLPDAMPLVLPSKHIEEKIKSIPAGDIATVNVQGSGNVLFNKMKVSTENLPGEVEKSIRNNERLIVSIHMDGNATYEDFVTVLRAVKNGDATRILVNNPVQ